MGKLDVTQMVWVDKKVWGVKMQRDSSEVRAVRHALAQEVTAGYAKLDNNPISQKQMSFYCVYHVASVAWVVLRNGKQKQSGDAERNRVSVELKRSIRGLNAALYMSKWHAPLSSDNPQEVARKRRSNK